MEDNYKIEKIIHRGSKVSLTISTLKKPLIVSEDTMINFQLVNGVVITESQFKLLLGEAQLLLCFDRARNSLAFRAHSVGELIIKLKQKGFSPDEIEPTISKLKDIQLLDDNQYALKLAEKINREKPCGRSILVAQLRKKLIDRELAEKTADMILKETDVVELAIKALSKRIQQFSQFELEEAKKKAYNYLSRRGFSYDAAKKAFEQLHIETKEE